MMRSPYPGLLINLAYAAGNWCIGFVTHSWWFITAGAYYTVLSAARFCVLTISRKSREKPDMDLFAKRITGLLLIGMSVCLIGVNTLSAVAERGKRLHEIIMIAVAAGAFAKITLAVIGMAKARHSASQAAKTLRNISLADSFVSIYSLQRSMLVSFPGMNPHEIQRFNILTGTAVWFIVLLLGINLTGGKRWNMAKS